MPYNIFAIAGVNESMMNLMLNIFVLHQKQNLEQRFGTSEMHLRSSVALSAVRSKAMVLLLLIRSRLVLPPWDSIIVSRSVVSYFG